MSDAPTPSAANAGTIPLLRRLFAEHGRQHLRSYIGAGCLMAVGAVATAISAWLLKPVLNGMVEAEGFKTLRLLAWAVAGLFILRGMATYGYLVVLSRTGNKIVAGVQTRLFDHLLRQDMRFFQDRHSTDFMARLSLAANGVRDTLQVLITSMGRDVLTLAGLIAVMIVQDPLMALMALSVMPVGGYFLSRLIRKVRKSARRSFDGSARIMQTMQETLQGVRIVKSFNLEDIMRQRMAVSVREVEKSVNSMAAGMAVSSPIADALAGIAIGAVIFYGSWRVTIAGADPGSFFSFVAALLLAYEPAKRLARLNLDIQNGLTGARLIYEVLDLPAAETPQPHLPPLQVSSGRIVFDKVRFAYRPGEYVLDGLDLVAEPNATTALVGPSGGGKSTIIAMIQRFYAPESGTVSIDGQTLDGVGLASLRDRIAFVAQDVFLFRGTIRDNIALGRPGATDAEIQEAARMANAHEFITGFATGYETSVGEQGAQLSGGQRQRIAIARAFLKNAPIILLDEPTAALDSESEREVQKALDHLREGRTTLVVAHRLQTIVNSDRICVIENGRAVEAGTHHELLARRGTYHAFFAAQFGENAAPLRIASGAGPR
ncbi:MAG: ABC transporter ATP-binding protein [Beijerinckiaceae bacterium]|nr:ABC transporter ATP-binding protein [Beijerinckiaceae bacterium]